MPHPTPDLHVCVACPDREEGEARDRDVLLPDHAAWLEHMLFEHEADPAALLPTHRCAPKRCAAKTNRAAPTAYPYVLLDAPAPVRLAPVPLAGLAQLSLLEAA